MCIELTQILNATNFACKVDFAEHVLKRSEDVLRFSDFSFDEARKQILADFKVICVELMWNVPANSSVLSPTIQNSVQITEPEVNVLVQVAVFSASTEEAIF